MSEIETRVINIDVDDMRLKLNTINALKVKEENQINKIYDFPDRSLLNQKGYARIRIVEDLLNKESKVYMTTKKILSQEKFKVMEENEVVIDDAVMGEKLFFSLGLVLTETIKKYRESYKYKNTLIEIDINDKTFCPFPYIEIESPTEDELEAVIKLLGYKMEDTTSKTIYQIIKEL